MSTNISQILIVSGVGRLRDSLRVLLKSCFPQIVIDEAETSTAALQLLADSPRALVLLDAALPGEQFRQALEWFDLCLVLAHSFAQQKQAQNVGANVVLLDRFTAASLCAAVEAGMQGC
jgi:DNA-binding NarL/FixJ family response regulator